MDEEIQYNSNPGLTQPFLSLGAQRGGVVYINTPFALFCTKEMPRKGAVKVELSIFFSLQCPWSGTKRAPN